MTTRRGHVALAGLSAPAQGAGDAPIAAAKPLLSTAAVIDDWLADLGLADVLRAGIEAWIPGTSEDAFARVLVDAETILAEGCSPLDAGMWGSEMLGMLALPGLEVAAVEDLVEEMVVPMAEASCTPTALAVLSVLGALGGPRLSRAAALARQHLVGAGVVVPHWSESLGAPRVGSCWVYGDDFGDQESLVLSFAYGRKKHAVCVLIDHTLGGGVKDAYVSARVPTLRKHMFEAAEDDQVTFCEELAPADAADRMRRAIASPECPWAPDQVQGVTCTRALLRSRVRLVLGDR